VVRPVALVCLFAILSVGLEVVFRHWFPGMALGWHHAALTVWGAVVALVAYAIVYVPMRRQQHRLTATAEELTRVVQSYLANIGSGRPAASGRHPFENPHLAHCRKVLDCDRFDCPMHDSPGKRCWQVMALRRAHDPYSARVEIEECLKCRVFRESCPDKLTELGESFNNLVFLLEEGGEQVGRLRAQIIEKEKMAAVGQIAAGVAHEVGNPLSSISAIVQMLRRGRSDPAMTEQLDLIQTHIQRISAIVRQLVTMARPTAENWEWIDVGKVLDEAVRLISFDRRARNIEIVFEPPRQPLGTCGLRGELQQVFINLAINALDAMPEGGRLRIRIYPDAACGRIITSFEDTGGGIPPETGRRVFEPFFTTKEPGHGTGLGLAVSYGIVQKHGGTIDFRSVPGQGTVFIVELPVLRRPPG